MDKDPHSLCSGCIGKECSADDGCDECYEWSDDIWTKISDNCVKLAAERERKAKAASFSGFSPFVPVPLRCLCSSFDNSVLSTVAASINTCNITYATSS